MEIRRILCPVDLDDATSSRLVAHAVELARRFGASLELLHVWEMAMPPFVDVPGVQFSDPDTEELRRKLDALASAEEGSGVSITTRLQFGDPARIILGDRARPSTDLIVMGTHGRRGLSRALLGSVAELVVRRRPFPC